MSYRVQPFTQRYSPDGKGHAPRVVNEQLFERRIGRKDYFCAVCGVRIPHGFARLVNGDYSIHLHSRCVRLRELDIDHIYISHSAPTLDGSVEWFVVKPNTWGLEDEILSLLRARRTVVLLKGVKAKLSTVVVVVADVADLDVN